MNNRTIPSFLAPITEQLELNQPILVSIDLLSNYAREVNSGIPATRIAFELKQRGWLLPTPARGIYEFSPGANAGAFSRGNKMLGIKALSMANPAVEWFYSYQSALYMHGIAKQLPDNPQITIVGKNYHDIPFAFRKVTNSVFNPNLAPVIIRENPVEKLETLLVHICTKPRQIKGWDIYEEYLQEIWNSCNISLIEEELIGRSKATITRLKRLLKTIDVKLEI